MRFASNCIYWFDHPTVFIFCVYVSPPHTHTSRRYISNSRAGKFSFTHLNTSHMDCFYRVISLHSCPWVARLEWWAIHVRFYCGRKNIYVNIIEIISLKCALLVKALSTKKTKPSAATTSMDFFCRIEAQAERR